MRFMRSVCLTVAAAVLVTAVPARAQQFAWFKYQEYEGWIEDTGNAVRIKLVPFLSGPDLAPPASPYFFNFETVVGHQAAAHDLVGRNGGVETTGHQHQRLLQRTQRITADAIVLAVDHEQPLVANFDTNFDFRLFQVDSGGTALAA